jgi:hypothetical protein
MAETSSGEAGIMLPQLGYGTMAGIITSALEKFLGWFQVSMKMIMQSGAAPSLSHEFQTQFLAEADNFSSLCCREFATMIKNSSSQPEVRDTSEPVLARLIRNRCFEALDTSLLEYVEILERSHINLGQIREKLGDSKVRDSLARKASNNQGTSDADGASLVQKRKMTAVLKILEYLEQFEKLAEELLDYGAHKLFGAEADFSMQKSFLFSIQDNIQAKYQGAMTALEGFEEVKRKRWEDQRTAETAAVKEAALTSMLYASNKKSSLGYMIAGGVCALLVWVASSSGITHPYVLIATGLVAVVGVFFFFKGIANLTKH